MILKPQLNPTDEQEILDYYLAHYDEVHVTTCDKCSQDLAIEVTGKVSGYLPNDYGYTVIPFGDQLLASRVRTDGSMGYQCRCGNDTRGNAIEEALSPTGAFLPHEVANIMQKYKDIGHKPNIKFKGNKEVHDTFTRERVK